MARIRFKRGTAAQIAAASAANGLVQGEPYLTTDTSTVVVGTGPNTSVTLQGVVAAGTTDQYRRGDNSWQDFASSVRAAVLTGFSTASSAAVAATDSVLAALGKLQAQVSAKANSASPTLTGATFNDGYTEEFPAAVNSGSAYPVVAANGSIQEITLTANTTLTFPAHVRGYGFTLLLVQDAIGGRTVTFPASVRNDDDASITVTTTAGRTTVVSFLSDGTYWISSAGSRNVRRAA